MLTGPHFAPRCAARRGASAGAPLANAHAQHPKQGTGRAGLAGGRREGKGAAASAGSVPRPAVCLGGRCLPRAAAAPARPSLKSQARAPALFTSHPLLATHPAHPPAPPASSDKSSKNGLQPSRRRRRRRARPPDPCRRDPSCQVSQWGLRSRSHVMRRSRRRLVPRPLAPAAHTARLPSHCGPSLQRPRPERAVCRLWRRPRPLQRIWHPGQRRAELCSDHILYRRLRSERRRLDRRAQDGSQVDWLEPPNSLRLSCCLHRPCSSLVPPHSL